MTRANTTEFVTASEQPHVTMFLLIQLDFDSGTVRLATLGHDVTYDGHTWTAAQGIGAIEPITETADGAMGLSFTLAAATEASIASALTEPVQGRSITLKLAILDGTTLRVDPNVWSGTFDVMTIQDGVKPLIKVTAEHDMVRWQTPSGALMSAADQAQVDPADMFFEFAAEMSEKTIVWPSKEALA